MIKELALAALNNYLSGSPGSGETSESAGFLKELQRAHDGRATDPANRTPAPRPAADGVQTQRATRPPEQTPRQRDDGTPRSGSGDTDGTRRSAEADRMKSGQQPARSEGTERASRPGESRRGTDAAADAAPAEEDTIAAATRSDQTDETDRPSDTDQALAATLALLAGVPVTADATATTQATHAAAATEAAAQMLAAVRRTTGDASADPAAQTTTEQRPAGERLIGEVLDAPESAAAEAAAQAPDEAVSGPAAPAQTRRAAIDLQSNGSDSGDRSLPAAALTLAASFAPSTHEAVAERGDALDGSSRHDRATRHVGELPVGLAAGFAGALARAEASATAAAPGGTIVHAPLGSPAFAPEFAERISTLIAGGIERAEIVVSPKELGPVRIELTMKGDDARLVFTAAHPDTRQAIEQSSALLRSMLADQGLTLGRMDVGHGGDPRAGGHGQQPPAPSEGSGGQTWQRDGGTTGTPAAAAPRGLLDLFA